MNIQCLILWKVATPRHGELMVNAPSEEEALIKALLFIEETPLDKIHKTKLEDLKTVGEPTVIQATII